MPDGFLLVVYYYLSIVAKYLKKKAKANSSRPTPQPLSQKELIKMRSRLEVAQQLRIHAAEARTRLQGAKERQEGAKRMQEEAKRIQEEATRALRSATARVNTLTREVRDIEADPSFLKAASDKRRALA